MSSKYRTYGGKNHSDFTTHDMKGVSHWTCAECGKRSFRNRKDAKEAARFRFPGKKMRFYKCNGYWHFTSRSSPGQSRRWRAYTRGREE